MLLILIILKLLTVSAYDCKFQPDLGNWEYFHDITTSSSSSKEVQYHFHQGMMHMSGFNLVEAQNSFACCQHFDPKNPMCYYGLAMSHGPFLNEPIKNEDDIILATNYTRYAYDLLENNKKVYKESEITLINSYLYLFN